MAKRKRKRQPKKGCKTCRFLKKEKDDDGDVRYVCRVPFFDPEEVRTPMWCRLDSDGRTIGYHNLKNIWDNQGSDCQTYEVKRG